MSDRDETITSCATLSPDAVIVEGAAGTVVEYNAAAQSLFGYDRDEVIGWPLVDLVWAEPWPDSATPGRERLFRRKDGRTFIGDVSRGHVRTAMGSYVIHAVRDVTAQKAIEARVREQSRVVGESISLAAHELRAPLNAIVGFCELLSEGEMALQSERDRELMGCVLVSSRHLLRLVNDILSSARRQAMSEDAGLDDPAQMAGAPDDEPASSRL
ncbi:MAG TPA: PAS domain S-box protein [Polyangia bacterium]|nr:PAS domain S-box protein [Polyangia bacterium]